MIKKLLTAAIAMVFLMSLCDSALAVKDASQVVHKAVVASAPGAFRQNFVPTPDAYNPPAPSTLPTRGNMPGGAVYNRGGGPGTNEYFDCNLKYYWNVNSAATRYNTNGDKWKLNNLEFMFNGSTGTGGVTAFVWSDDGLGYPGAVIYSVNVPHASVQTYPNATNLNIAAANVVINDAPFFVGFKSNVTTQNYRIGSDDGSCGAVHSYTNISSYWYQFKEATSPETDYNWSMTVNASVTAATCADVRYDNPAIGSYVASSGFGLDSIPFAVKFNAASKCTVKTVMVNISSSGRLGTGGITIELWSDNSGFPGVVTYTQTVADGALLIPGQNNITLTTPQVFTAVDFHVSYRVTVPTDIYKLRWDSDGMQGYSTTRYGGVWYLNTSFWTPPADGDYRIWINQCCLGVQATNCYNVNYAGAPYYVWPEPDAYGDSLRNMRFTPAPGPACTVKTLHLSFYGSAPTVGTPGAYVYIWNSGGSGSGGPAGSFPTTVANTFTVGTVTSFFPTATNITVPPGVTYATDFHVGYSVKHNAISDVLAIVSDDGSSGTGRSIEYYAGGWETMPWGFGIDVNFLINVDLCCPNPNFCGISCNFNDQWPTYGHDFARTSQSGLSLGDVCGIRNKWVYNPGGTTLVNTPTQTIKDDRVFILYDNRVVALNLMTGIEIWRSNDVTLAPLYAGFINTGMRGAPTVDDTLIYIPCGSLKNVICSRAVDGVPKWKRGAAAGTPLPGAPGTLQFAPTVIIGNDLVFGDGNGQIYRLDKLTGADIGFAQLYADPPTNTKLASTFTSPAYDGTSLYFGVSTGDPPSASGGGAIWKVNLSGLGFATVWTFVSPFTATLHEGFTSGPSIRCHNVFIHSNFNLNFNPPATATGWRNALVDSTGLAKFGSYFLFGRGRYAPPASTNDTWYLAGDCGFGIASDAGTGRGARAVNFANSTIWADLGAVGTFENGLQNSVALTCDPYAIYGTRDPFVNLDGHWRIRDGATGALMMDYLLTGSVNGSSLARASDGKAYIVFSIQTSGHGTAGGKVFGMCDQGPRPRLVVPTMLVNFTSTNTSESTPVQRQHTGALKNSGCLTLTYNADLAGGFPTARPNTYSVNPALEEAAVNLSNNLVEHQVGEFMNNSKMSGKIIASSFKFDDEGEPIPAALSIKPAKANSTALAAPAWVSWILPSVAPVSVSGSIAPAGSENFKFEFDRSGMMLLSDNYFFVDIGSNDPDFNLEDPLNPVQATIEYHIPYVYCPRDTGRMRFGTTGREWYSNQGELSDGALSGEFTPSGAMEGDMFEGSMWFMSNMDNAAWNLTDAATPPSADFGYLFPFYISGTTCGSCAFATTLPVEYTTTSGASYAFTIGDLCTFAMIDSLQSGGVWPNQIGPSIGILVKYREVGTYNVSGNDFGDFKLIVADIINRNAGAINGLYYGSIIDWDVGAGADVVAGDVDKGYVYQHDGVKARASIGLPLKGSYYLDGTKTDPMYNAYIIDNPAEIYPTAVPCPQCHVDSLFAWIDGWPAGQINWSVDPIAPDDHSSHIAFGKVNLAGFATQSYGWAFWGKDNSATIDADIINRSQFINKYAGFARGDVNNDGTLDLRDLVYLSRYIAALGNGPVPFKHLGDVNCDGAIDGLDCTLLQNYFFLGGTPPKGKFMF